MSKPDQFYRMLRNALAVEHGAYEAYKGHAKSLYLKYSDKEAGEVLDIRAEELAHQYKLRAIMQRFNVKENVWLNRMFIVIGKTISFLCWHTGYKAPMFGAKILEKTAGVNYRKMASLARDMKFPDLDKEITSMAEAEERHEAYFASKL